MGGGFYSDKDFASYRTSKASSGAKPFDYSAKVKATGGAIAMALDPAYGGRRISRSPEPGVIARPVTVMLDVTGSNIRNAGKVHADLPHLMGLLASQNWIGGHLNLQIGAIGDATCDQFPLQLSPFEVDGVVLDKWLELLILESGGGGQKTESYELAMWAACHQNQLEAWDRGERGDLFIIFDENPYGQVSVSELRRLYQAQDTSAIGTGIELTDNQKTASLDNGVTLPQSNIPLKQMVAELHQRYHVWGIIGSESGYYDDREVLDTWERILGPERLIKLPDAGDVSKMIAALLGHRNGIAAPQIYGELANIGADRGTLNAISNALAASGASNTMLPPALKPTSTSSGVTRL